MEVNTMTNEKLNAAQVENPVDMEHIKLALQGDTQYVNHVLRYYPYGRAFTSGGNQVIVEVALTQTGNEGGQPYWRWYGFESRVEWCACFVSRCADQCGYIDSGNTLSVIMKSSVTVHPHIKMPAALRLVHKFQRMFTFAHLYSSR